ncbi:MAG: hypothetical protein ACHQ1H_11315 [Nitrososphaerales archaeon]
MSIHIGIGGGRLANIAVFVITWVPVYDVWQFKKYGPNSSSLVSIPLSTKIVTDHLIIELKISKGYGLIIRP